VDGRGFKSKTEKVAPAASLVAFTMGYYVYVRHGTSVYWHIKTRLESGPVTADMTPTVVHSFKVLINDVKPDHSLTHLRVDMTSDWCDNVIGKRAILYAISNIPENPF